MPTTAAPASLPRPDEFQGLIGHGEEDRIRGHGFYHIGGDADRAETPINTSAWTMALARVPDRFSGLVIVSISFFCRRQTAVRGDDAFAVAEQDLAAAQLAAYGRWRIRQRLRR